MSPFESNNPLDKENKLVGITAIEDFIYTNFGLSQPINMRDAKLSYSTIKEDQIKTLEILAFDQGLTTSKTSETTPEGVTVYEIRITEK